MLVDGPRELIVELPRDKGHQECSQSDNTRNDDQERLRLIPNVQLDLVHVVQGCHSFSNLLDLHRSVDQESDVADTQSDDLNCVLHSQRIVDQHQFVEETEAIEGKEGGDCFGGGTVVGEFLDLEVREDIPRERQLARERSHRGRGKEGSRTIPNPVLQ